MQADFNFFTHSHVIQSLLKSRCNCQASLSVLPYAFSSLADVLYTDSAIAPIPPTQDITLKKSKSQNL